MYKTQISKLDFAYSDQKCVKKISLDITNKINKINKDNNKN